MTTMEGGTVLGVRHTHACVLTFHTQAHGHSRLPPRPPPAVLLTSSAQAEPYSRQPRIEVTSSLATYSHP